MLAYALGRKLEYLRCRDGQADHAGRRQGRLQVLARGGRGGHELPVPAPAGEGIVDRIAANSRIGATRSGGRSMTKSWHITRRTMLRGMGAASRCRGWRRWLPLGAGGRRASRPPLRMVFVYHPLGAETTAWKGVTGAGQGHAADATLQPLEPVKEHLLILDGLDGRPHPSSGHNRSACLWLSSAPPGKADTWGVETDVTLDQVLAPKLSAGARAEVAGAELHHRRQPDARDERLLARPRRADGRRDQPARRLRPHVRRRRRRPQTQERPRRGRRRRAGS